MERTDQWPRVHTCLYDWCPKKSDECERCDAMVNILRAPRTADEAAEAMDNGRNTGGK